MAGKMEFHPKLPYRLPINERKLPKKVENSEQMTAAGVEFNNS